MEREEQRSPLTQLPLIPFGIISNYLDNKNRYKLASACLPFWHFLCQCITIENLKMTKGIEGKEIYSYIHNLNCRRIFNFDLFPSLQYLKFCLYNNNIRDKGATALSQLKESKTLQQLTLNLYFNNINGILIC